MYWIVLQNGQIPHMCLSSDISWFFSSYPEKKSLLVAKMSLICFKKEKKLNDNRMFWNPCSLLIWLDWFSKNYVYCFISYTIPHVAEHRDHSVHKLSLVSKEDTAFSQIYNKSHIRTRWIPLTWHYIANKKVIQKGLKWTSFAYARTYVSWFSFRSS